MQEEGKLYLLKEKWWKEMHGKTCDVSEYIYKICIICNVVSWMFQYTCTQRITYGINI